jgi:hypothetical protein
MGLYFIGVYRDTGKMVREMENVLAYNAKLSAVAAIQADASFLLPGIGPVTVLGMSLQP